MNSVESSTVVYSRLSALDPESASKIMGFILIHGPNEADMMSLATAPDAILQQLINKGKSYSNNLASSASALHSPVSLPSGFRCNEIKAAALSPSYASVVNGNGRVGEEVVEEEFESRNPKSDDELYDLGLDAHRFLNSHKRSLSLSDAAGFGWRSSAGSGGIGGASSPGKFDEFEQEMLRSRTTQQQIMSGSSFHYNNKYFTDSPRSMAAAMMMGDELHKLGQLRHGLGDIAFMGCSSSSSRQIYLTFPADSTFREEDVSNYFSIYGPVQDVRIPYQQKRMFGFVTFVHPETVRIILAKGNPHFVCDSRVLVKPYKEKGKVEKKHLMMQQQLERGELLCSSPPGVDIRDFDVRFGPRMFYNNTQDQLMRRKLGEQAEFQKALELQNRKLASLQLLDVNNLPQRHPFSPNHSLSPSAAVSSPSRHPLLSPNHMRSMSAFNQEAFEENVTAPTLSLPRVLANRQMSLERFPNVNNHKDYTSNNTSENGMLADSAANESTSIRNSVDPVLPDTLDDTILTNSAFSRQSLAANNNTATCSLPFSSNNSTIVSAACLANVALPKSRFLEDPCFGATGRRAIEM